MISLFRIIQYVLYGSVANDFYSINVHIQYEPAI